MEGVSDESSMGPSSAKASHDWELGRRWEEEEREWSEVGLGRKVREGERREGLRRRG